jgi:hypothetical protein
MHDVFISYSEKDHDKVENIRHTLEANGITCWFAPVDIHGTQDFTEVIPQAIRNSKAFLLLMSKNAQESKWVKRELGVADDIDIPIFTLFLEDCPLRDHFDFVLHFNQHYHASLGEVEQLKRLISDLKNSLEHCEEKVVLPKKKKRKKWLIPVIAAVLVALVAASLIIFLPEKDGKKDSKDGKYIIWNPTYNIALSSKQKNVHYHQGDQVMIKDDKLTDYDDSLVWSITFIEDDVITISCNGKNLGMQAGYNGIGLGENYSCDRWQLLKQDDNTYLILNTECKFYLEWFVEKDNWSTHDKLNSSNRDQFLLKLEKIS